ncbi:hypothetical protein AWZ03_007596 [Drosophila navojoa]|uniref:KIND domain-containing protein n=1 Tax=Drosophila navojoa TaxID=7232 RepID=A0A484BAW8_DRONA|nr:hypothetical protein AWZ03_007596 [Drosophila navojoa]
MTELQLDNSLKGDVDDADASVGKAITAATAATTTTTVPPAATTTVATTPKVTTKRRQFAEGEAEEGFLSTSPDSANGDAHAHGHTRTHHTHTHVQPRELQQSNGNGNRDLTEPLDASALLQQAFYQCSCTDQCVSLNNILDCFKAPVSEDQAWALIYQFITLYLKVAEQALHCSSEDYEAHLPTRFELHLHRDGSVHFSGQEQKQQLKQSPAELQHDDSASSSGDSSVVMDRAFDNNNHHTPLVSAHRKV